jgi:hypothetical protein
MSDNFEKHKEAINRLYRETKDVLWTPQFATLVLLSFGILVFTIFLNFVYFSFGNLLIAFLVYLLEAVLPFVLLIFHQRKVYETVREKAFELEAANPGIYKAYEEWRSQAAPPTD